jgi:DNA invertase Pin-like site-specific DNA recombinase
MQEFIAYRRLASSERAQPDLRLDAQAAAILRFVQSRGGVLVRDFIEREAGKGSDVLERRPRLHEALEAAKQRSAVLVVARLDRLSRDVRFLSHCIDAGVEFAAADHPDADAFMLHIHAGIAGRERERAGRRIAEALQAKKQAALAQGRANPVGNMRSLEPHNKSRQAAAQAFARQLAPMLEAYQRAGLTQRAMVEALNRDGVTTAAGGSWSLLQLQRVLARLSR